MRRPASAEELASSLEVLAGAGSAWPLGRDVGDDWVGLDRLAQSEVWSPVAERVAQRLGGAERRVADSLLLLGLAARLWYVTLVPAATTGVLLDPAYLLVTDDQGALSLGVREVGGWADVTAADVGALVTAALAPVVAALRLPGGLAWGNVASALYGVRRLAPVGSWVEVLRDRGPLAGSLERDGRRRSCCLFYRVPGGGLCADCCLERVPG